MAANEHTSTRVASIAARGLDDPHSLTAEEIRAVCASALTQAPDHRPAGELALYNALTIARRYASPPPVTLLSLGAALSTERSRLAGESTLADVLISHYGPGFEVTKRSV